MFLSTKVKKSQTTLTILRYSGVARSVLAVCLFFAVFLGSCQLWSLVSSAIEPSRTDWPMWRYDASRSAASPGQLPARLHLQWVRELPKPSPAWSKEQYKLQFDRSYEPVVMGNQIFVPSMVRDKVTAYDTDSGEENWRFYCDGPVRFAPIAWKDKIYFVSDDGYLYCLNAKKGTLLWKFRLGPSERRILGNGRLISAWPARGAPVLYDGKIYCAASIWPFMGIFIYCLDADTGSVVWENSGSGSMYIQQQHNSDAFAGVAPQGYMAATEEKLLITSRTVPACYDRRNGKFLYYRLSDRSYGKYVGGYDVSVWKDWFFNNGVIYRLRDGEGMVKTAACVMTDEAVIAFDKDGDLVAYRPEVTKDAKSEKTLIKGRQLWKMKTQPALDKIYLKAGTRLYGSNSQGIIAAVDVPGNNRQGRISWQHNIRGDVWNMLAADGKLFVVTEQGRLYCFAGRRVQPKRYQILNRELPKAPKKLRRKARQILKKSQNNSGYCLLLGSGDGSLLKELLRQSEMHFIVVESDTNKVASLRKELDQAGLYGERVSVMSGDITTIQAPPYIASLIVAEKLAKAGVGKSNVFAEKVFYSLRPYGGVAWLGANKKQQLRLYRQLTDSYLGGCRIEGRRDAILLKRAGALPGSSDWTHQHGDIANTVCSADNLRLPLGLLWFGDDSDFTDVLPRHAHGPPEQVVGGRLFIQGINSISARDVYTGRTLWKKPLKNLNTFGVYYDSSYKHDFRDLSYNQLHIPGANVRGTNFVATEENVYVLEGAKCHVLNAAMGESLRIFSLPDSNGESPKDWGYIGVYKDYLIAGSDFVRYSGLFEQNDKGVRKQFSFLDKSTSKQLVVMNRHTGRVLWTIAARHGFIHNGIVAGKDKIFCLDGIPPYIRKIAGERGIDLGPRYGLLALDVGSGETIWENTDDVFGSWLGYSARYDILLQAYRKSRDMVWEPGNRMATYHGRTGEVIWDKKIEYNGPCILGGDRIITQESAYSILTGLQQMRKHPLTGERVRWQYSRNHGCNTATASENMLTFRSAAAGYFDLEGDGGTGNFGGFRSGCTSNLVVANGVLNAPDYTRTCTCSYQNQTSLAMIHMPEVETWTFNTIEPSKAAIRRIGVNFGAPGDRKAENGTLWLDYPSRGGKSPVVDVTIMPKKPTWFRKHSALLRRGNLKWVEASGAKGIKTISVRIVSGKNKEARGSDNKGSKGLYTVRLYFMEPKHIEPGQRVFDVALQGKIVLEDFDVIKETGSANVGLMKEFPGVNISDSLIVSLTGTTGDFETVICGIEIVAEN
jgi:outer membrane protein assembly factor BamB